VPRSTPAVTGVVCWVLMVGLITFLQYVSLCLMLSEPVDIVRTFAQKNGTSYHLWLSCVLSTFIKRILDLIGLVGTHLSSLPASIHHAAHDDHI